MSIISLPFTMFSGLQKNVIDRVTRVFNIDIEYHLWCWHKEYNSEMKNKSIKASMGCSVSLSIFCFFAMSIISSAAFRFLGVEFWILRLLMTVANFCGVVGRDFLVLEVTLYNVFFDLYPVSALSGKSINSIFFLAFLVLVSNPDLLFGTLFLPLP